MISPVSAWVSHAPRQSWLPCQRLSTCKALLPLCYTPYLQREGAYSCAVIVANNQNRESWNVAGESNSPTYNGNSYSGQMPSSAVRPEGKGFKTVLPLSCSRSCLSEWQETLNPVWIGVQGGKANVIHCIEKLGCVRWSTGTNSWLLIHSLGQFWYL